MISTDLKGVTNPDDAHWAALDLLDHKSIEVVDGRWVDRHGYRYRMRKLCEREKDVAFDAVSATKRAAKFEMKGKANDGLR